MLNIAVDGTSASGKSTICEMLAKKLNILHLNTGALYRSYALYFILNNLPIKSPDDADKFFEKIHIKVSFESKMQINLLNDKDITTLLNNPHVAEYSSIISQNQKVRNKIKEIQLNLANNNDILIEGRDIGSEIIPNAKFKFFITASLEERARRRYIQLKEIDKNIKYEDILNSLKERDFKDMNRKISPLIIPNDAIIIDTTNKTIDEAVNLMYEIILKG